MNNADTRKKLFSLTNSLIVLAKNLLLLLIICTLALSIMIWLEDDLVTHTASDGNWQIVTDLGVFGELFTEIDYRVIDHFPMASISGSTIMIVYLVFSALPKLIIFWTLARLLVKIINLRPAEDTYFVPHLSTRLATLSVFTILFSLVEGGLISIILSFLSDFHAIRLFNFNYPFLLIGLAINFTGRLYGQAAREVEANEGIL